MSIREDLKAYLDGELGAARRTEVERELAKDPSLQKELDDLRVLSEGIQSYANEPEVFGLERTLAAVNKPLPWWKLLLSGRMPLATAAVGVAAVVIVGAAIFPVFSQSGESAKRGMQLSRYENVAAASPTDSDKYGAGEEQMKSPSAAGTTGGTTTGTTGGGQDYSDGLKDGALPDIDAGIRLKGRISQGGVSNGAPDMQANQAKVDPPTAGTEPSSSDRKIIRTADLSVRVESAERAQRAAEGIATGLGGFVENSSGSDMQGELPITRVVIRVPEKSFNTALERLSKIDGTAEVLSRTISGDDVTVQYADIESKLKTLRQAENRYRAIMGQTRKIGEVLSVQERLDQVRQEIEGHEAQRRTLAKQSAMSTISATFEQRVEPGRPEAPKDWLDSTWAGAVNGLAAVGRFLAQVAVNLFVFAPIWLPALGLGWWLMRRSKIG